MRSPDLWFSAGCFLLVLAGCATGKKLVTTTGKVVGVTATTAITTGGKIASATIAGGVSVAKTVVTTTGSVAGSLAKTAVVTVVDCATGVTQQIPWTEGMKLYAATKTTEADAALKAFEILRGSQVIPAANPDKPTTNAPEPLLQPGDVINVSPLEP
ncbi:hypothetical protein LBMAG56_00460 [Verrucomicrobiota bacterium]|nr:hypothetical protein LBMAG56_00460 [Verrucomicrobiota bacterium]